MNRLTLDPIRLPALCGLFLLFLSLASPSASGVQDSRKGLVLREERAFDGYTLFAPLTSKVTYLIDMQGEVVHTWTCDSTPGYSVYLLDNGNLLRAARQPGDWAFDVAGLGGRIQEIDWEGEVVWEYVHAAADRMQHHDVEPLPDGNVLLIAWEVKGTAEVIAAGCDPALTADGVLWPDSVVEIEPVRPRGGVVVWEWRVWDHLIQDHDPSKENYGVVAEHPELIDVNATDRPDEPDDEELERLAALGYIGRADRRGRKADWNHANAVDYNPELDQIALSVLRFNEVWIIDHSTTTAEAAGHTGGRSGKGGDLLYRWGNPRVHGAGSAADQRLFAQHDVRWIERGRPGAGNLLVFNNGLGRPGGPGERYSSILEISPPLTEDGGYALGPGSSFGPRQPAWSHVASPPVALFATNVSGAQRLPNGNTLICSGPLGRIIEIDAEGEVVWEYHSPFPPRSAGSSSGAGRGSSNAIFRATRLAPDHPGLEGRLD